MHLHILSLLYIMKKTFWKMYANVSVLVSVLEKEQGLGLATACLGLGLAG